MRRTATLAVACLAIGAQSPHLMAGEIDAGLEEVLKNTERGEVVSSLVYLWDQGDAQGMVAQRDDLRRSRDRRNEEVVRTLRDTADLTQGDLVDHIEQLTQAGRVSQYKAFWIANVIRVDATEDTLRALAKHPDVMRIYYNMPLEGVLPVEDEQDDRPGGPAEPMPIGAVEPGVDAVRAPEVWDMGFNGEGILVATLDTGVDGQHPALASRWRGNDPEYANNPEWAWFDPVTDTTVPQDFGWSSHGTHTMGSVLGGAPGDQVGVAPGAEWIHAAVIDRVDIDTTVADAIASFEWMVNPDGNATTSWDVPHVCSNSWGVTSSMGYPNCDETFWTFIDNSEAAGTIQLFSAGNEGASGLRRPADRATDEYRSVAVASIDPDVAGWPLSSFSSQGPTFCTPSGEVAIKPDISAPGDGIRSSVSGGGYGEKSGTSMASPHVNGVVALMLQACPDITADEVKQIIYDTAFDLGDAGKDNQYGWGMIDAYEAVLATQAACTISVFPENPPSFVDPGVTSTFNVSVVEASEDLVPGSAELYYRVNGGSFTATPLTDLGDGLFEATLPAIQCDDLLDYYLRVEGDGGTVRTSPADAPDSFYTAQAGEMVTSLDFDQNFASGQPAGWSASGLWNFTSSCAVNGDCQGSQWAYYGQTGACDFDAGETEGTLQSNSISIPAVAPGGQIVLSFCYNLDAEGSSTYDRATFAIQGSGEEALLSNSDEWTTYTTNITDYAGDDISLEWHFDSVDGIANGGNGWQVDNIRIEVTQLQCDDVSCQGDLSGDGQVNVTDMLQLLGEWGDCSGCSGDLDGNGAVNVSDLLLLLGEWGTCS